MTAEGVRHAFGAAPVLDGVDLSAVSGRVVGLVGPNGSGKTTLLRALYGALTPAAGRVEVDGRDVATLGPRQVAKDVAVVVQEHGGDLPLRVADMVLLGRTPHRPAFGGRQSGHDVDVAAAALDRVGATHLAQRMFAELSGGEKQRVLIARALAQEATHLLLDEPTNHLDVRYQHEVLSLVRSLVRSLGTTAVVVLHDLNLAAAYCDDLVLLDGGRVAAAGSPAHVLTTEVLEPVYGVRVRRLSDDAGGVHLAFSLPG